MDSNIQKSSEHESLIKSLFHKVVWTFKNIFVHSSFAPIEFHCIDQLHEQMIDKSL